MKTTEHTTTLFTDIGMLLKTRLQRGLPLPLSQCQTLWFVASREKPTMRDVAEHFKITAPSATFLVEELARSGLIERHANAKDRRKIELALTKKGRSIYKRASEKRSQVLHRMFEKLSERERADLNRLLTKVLSH